MSTDAWIESLPDLVLLMRRDGTILAHSGGRAVGELRPEEDASGRALGTVWPEAAAEVLVQLIRKAISLRAPTEARFREGSREYEARVIPQAPDRALCVVRALRGQNVGGQDAGLNAGPNADPYAGQAAGADAGAHAGLESSDERPRPQLDRRGFLRRFKESLSMAALREKPIAVAVIHVEGIADIAQVIAPRVSEQIMSTVVLRLAVPGNEPPWYLGQLNDSLLALVLESSDREVVERCLTQVCASLREPVAIGEAEFHLTPYAGVAILGQDASSPKLLLDHARSAATEARRCASPSVCFFTDTLRLRSLARLDIARELHEAIENHDIRFRYVGRHDLVTGDLVAWVGYLRWLHPLRGEIRPSEFLRVAEITGLAAALSRAVLRRLREDFLELAQSSAPDVRISFGALRHHVLHDHFISDIESFLAAGGLPAERLELRIAEKSLIARDPADFQALRERGVRLVVDEVGRGLGSLDWLARTPIWGLQLDRAWTTAIRNDPVALKVCRAGIAVATALGLTPIASGVDDEVQRSALLSLGCRHGTGDLYADAAADMSDSTLPSAAAARSP